MTADYWYNYLEQYRQSFCATKGNFNIEKIQQQSDKEILWISVGGQRMKLICYKGLKVDRFNAYIPPSDFPSIPKSFRPILVDKCNKVVIFKWRPGKMLFSFEDVVMNQVADATWCSVGKLLASIHENVFDGFSYVEMEPSHSKSSMMRYVFGSREEFRNFIFYSFVTSISSSLQSAVMRQLISLQRAVAIQEKCEEIFRWLQDNAIVLRDIEKFSILHGDVHPENIIVLPGQDVTLIDWERWCIGDPATDIAFLLEQMDQSNTEGHSLVLSSYCENRTPQFLGDFFCFVKRINLYKRIILGKFTAVVANGLCSSDPQVLNQPLFHHLYERLMSEDWREIECQ